jgi:hypothetical protein
VKIERGNPYRLRDTFAVEVLLDGVPIDYSRGLGSLGPQSGEDHREAWRALREGAAGSGGKRR